MKHFVVFGTHPRLSLAEFKAVQAGTGAAPTLCGSAAIVDDARWDGAVLMNKLGGTVKLGDVVHEIPTEDLDGEVLAELIKNNPRADRVVFGLTVFGGTPAFNKKQEKLALATKRVLTAVGRSVRWVTSDDDKPLSPAAVAKMHLTDEGYDIVLLVHGTTVSIGFTTQAQDADAWSLRDYGRPVRDDENGMLPPKLARMMVNLARVPEGGTLLDSFCGSGTVPMEAGLATKAAHIISSDVEAKQIDGTTKNLEWLFSQHVLRPDDRERFKTFVADARKLKAHIKPSSVDACVTEGFLGPLLSGHETKQTLENNVHAINTLWRDALVELHPLLVPHGRVVGVWPSFKSSHGMARVELDEQLEALGYRLVNPLEGWEVTNDPLLYHRQGQRVMRRIVILEKA